MHDEYFNPRNNSTTDSLNKSSKSTTNMPSRFLSCIYLAIKLTNSKRDIGIQIFNCLQKNQILKTMQIKDITLDDYTDDELLLLPSFDKESLKIARLANKIYKIYKGMMV